MLIFPAWEEAEEYFRRQRSKGAVVCSPPTPQQQAAHAMWVGQHIAGERWRGGTSVEASSSGNTILSPAMANGIAGL